MMNSLTKECGVCKEEFDEESRCPRIFNCFHTLCTTCINQLIGNNAKRCPFCRRTFDANIANDFMVNHTMLELVKCISIQASSSNITVNGPTPPRKKRISDLKKGTKKTSRYHHANCQEAQKQIEQNIQAVMTLQRNMTQENTMIENNVLPIFHNVISQNKQGSEELDKTSQNLLIRLKEIKGKNKQLADMTGKLDTCTANTFGETAILLDEAEEINTTIGEWFENFKELITEEEKTLQTTERKVKRSKEKVNIILEALNSWAERDEETFPGIATMAFQEENLPGQNLMTLSSWEDNDEDIDPIPRMTALTIQEENLPRQIMPQTLREMDATMKNLVEQGKIFAAQQEEGRRRFARISITDDKLCLHHLTEEPLPPDALVVEHSDVMRQVDPSSRLTFLELSVGGSTLGKIYIRLTPDTKRAQNFTLLCTGEMGPSYANTSILQVWDKGNEWERVRCAEFEENVAPEGMALVPELWEDIGGEYRRPWLAGTVGGEWWGLEDAVAAQFYINTKDNPEEVCDLAFGMVEYSLEVLNEAISHFPNMRGILIRDCGIVLPC